MSVDAARLRSRLFAIAMMCAAMICFTCLDTSAKFLGRELPSIEVVWARYMGAGIVALFASRVLVRPSLMCSRRPGLQMLRSSLLLGSTIANFFALRKLQLAETSTIGFLQPMCVAALAGPFRGEKVGGARMAAIFVGFIGVLIATRPGAGAFQPIVIVSVLGVICNAGYAIATRSVAAHDRPETTLAWTQIAGIALLTPILPWVWRTPPDAFGWMIMAGMGLFAVLGPWLVILGHQRAPAPALAPFNYTQLVWMIVAGLLIFGDVPPVATLVGAGVVVACGLFLLLHERRNVHNL